MQKITYNLTVIINGEKDFYSLLEGHEVVGLIKRIEKWEKE